MLNYDAPLYRPPSEANSLIFQVTLGCSFNQCSFCDMYRSKEYSERTWDEVKQEIDMMAKMMPDTKRVFLADGDAINLSTEYMLKILKYIREKFSRRPLSRKNRLTTRINRHNYTYPYPQQPTDTIIRKYNK